jgi:DNA repair protein RecN (Recombination protein N)
MLVSLEIRDVVLIDRLVLRFQPGLSALTGETGAGKSILLDALGLVLGARGDSGLLRQGAAQAVVTASFDLPPSHPVMALLRDNDMPDDEGLILRRTLTADGRSRAAVNDQSVSIGLLRQIGGQLVDIHGQFDQHGLLDPATHAPLLDAFGGHQSALKATASAYAAWRAAEKALGEAEEIAARARADEEELRQTARELRDLAPVVGEETDLAARRADLQHRDRLGEALTSSIEDSEEAVSRIAQAMRTLGRLPLNLSAGVEPATAALDRAAVELGDGAKLLEARLAALRSDGDSLEQVEERLYQIRAAARRLRATPDDLPEILVRAEAALATLEDGAALLPRLQKAADEAKANYRKAADALSAMRQKTARKLDQAVADELAPLKLDRARFRTVVAPAENPADWRKEGADRIAFEIATNPGAPHAPLAKVLSGGELNRVMLALQVILSATGSIPTLVFDEVDSGVGGAVAAAVGDRLARLGARTQVLVVTHSPQVAARADAHWRVSKSVDKTAALTTVEPLSQEERREEIARMLSGASVTDAARAAASDLMGLLL